MGLDSNGAYLKQKTMVIPAQAGIQDLGNMWPSWIPACAGMTNNEIFGLSKCHSG